MGWRIHEGGYLIEDTRGTIQERKSRIEDTGFMIRDGGRDDSCRTIPPTPLGLLNMKRSNTLNLT